ncbi:MAG: hypothetical protein IH851_00665 [Armatimonadetes bacterium]|nr:hypothetical protein [Armatimonadota bacterium]
MNRTLEDRVVRLEKANRRLALLCAGLVVLPLLALGGWQKGVAEVVRAKKFELIGDGGATRGELTVTTTGPRLRLYDANGEMRVLLAAPNGGDEVLSLDEGREAGPGHGPGLLLFDDSGVMRVWLTGHETVEGLTFTDSRGRPTYRIPPDKR